MWPDCASVCFSCFLKEEIFLSFNTVSALISPDLYLLSIPREAWSEFKFSLLTANTVCAEVVWMEILQVLFNRCASWYLILTLPNSHAPFKHSKTCVSVYFSSLRQQSSAANSFEDQLWLKKHLFTLYFVRSWFSLNGSRPRFIFLNQRRNRDKQQWAQN